MPSWDRLLFEKETPVTTTETNSAPALADTAAVVSSGPAQVYSIANPSANSINLYDNDTLTFVVLPNTTLTFNFPITFNNSLRVKNTGLAAVNYSIQYFEL